MTGTSSACVTFCAHLVRHTLEQYDVSPGILQSLRRYQHLPGFVGLPALHLESPDLVHRLGFQSQVRAHGNIVTGQVFDNLHLVIATFEFDHHRTTVLHQANRVVERLVRLRVTHERHVGDEKRAPQAARNGPAVINDVIHGYRHRRIVPLDNHAERISDEHKVGARRIDQHRETGIVGRQAGDRVAIVFHFAQCRDIDRWLRHAALFELGVH